MSVEPHDKKEVSSRSLRFLLILEEVARLGVPVTPTEVNKTLGLPKQTIHRIFSTLEESHFLQREMDGRHYSPGPRMRTMSLGTMSSIRTRAARLSVMQALSEKIGETINLVIPDRHNMIYLDRVETNWPLRVQFASGAKVPFHCTASGKIYLSSLPNSRLTPILEANELEKLTDNTLCDPDELRKELQVIRERGYSTDNEEFIEGLIAVATPIKDGNDRVVACLAFHAPTPRMSLEQAITHLDSLQEAAQKLSNILREES
ncbi:IclR family transcriptional regulator [Terasakiella sp. A23]|uniref:IclR family transcriptional regulator n=1 Tax=Terasakiella sp. FCG-A23 TaxID=3080561 RepID=UPI002954FD06|nr:IclR family transcriptional regulator [Terasakiella sp. A23]MDV7339624.1 IclR family transcriptional regulator [Terasakiella sp. A23]